MRKNYIVKGFKFAFYISVCMVLISCNRNKTTQQANHKDPGAVNIDENLANLLQPTNTQIVTTSTLIKGEYGSKIFTVEAQGIINYDTRNEQNIASRVSGRIERLLIKYNYQPIRKGQLIMEIYAPELAAAQQELLFFQEKATDLAMLDRAKQRLLLLGMTNSTINQLLKTKKVNYRIPVYSNADGFILEKTTQASVATPSAAPSSGGDGMSSMSGGSATPEAPVASTPANAPVILREGQYINAGQSLFTVYNANNSIAEFSLIPGLASLIKKGDQLLFYKIADQCTAVNAQIGLIQPVFKQGENFTIARIYLKKSNFKIGELLIAKIPVLINASWWLPKTAVVTLGGKKVIFKKEGNVVVPTTIKTGVTINGMVQILTNLDQWQVSKHAAYLIDSESFIK